MSEEEHKLPPFPEITILELYKIRGGVVRSEGAAVAIARVILADLYGENMVSGYDPFTAIEHADRWVIRGSGDSSFSPTIVISKDDGRVIDMDVRMPVE